MTKKICLLIIDIKDNYQTVLEENKLSHTKIVEIEDKPCKKKTIKKELNIEECILSDDD